MFTLTLSTDGGAFGEHWADRDAELARVLRAAATMIEGASCDLYGTELALFDAGGKPCGSLLIGEAS